ncbi:hypothetical protein M3Y99_00771300 [Aphelenchoides fujianensis]|nr:hypothetical protein M3Y99_00771300 [Aphelenchoides fujianensis]
MKGRTLILLLLIVLLIGAAYYLLQIGVLCLHATCPDPKKVCDLVLYPKSLFGAGVCHAP